VDSFFHVLSLLHFINLFFRHYTSFLPWMIGFFSGLEVMHKDALEKNALHITSALYTVTTQAAPSGQSSGDSSGQLSDSLTSSRRIQRRRSLPCILSTVKSITGNNSH
jgi:hypothetical protein